MHETLIELARESPDAQTFEARALDALGRDVGFDFAFFAQKDDETVTTVGLDRSAIAKALAAGSPHARETLPIKRAALAARGVAVDTEVLGASRVRETHYHRELARPVGGRTSLLAYPSLRGRVTGVMMLGRSRGAFADHEIRRVESILPALSVARASFGPVPFDEVALPASPRDPHRLLDRLGLGPKRAIACVASPSSEIVVRDRSGFREMVARSAAGEMIWSRVSLTRPSESGWPYIELFHLAAALASRRRRALFIGCGGAVALRQFARVYPGIQMDLVESEPRVVELARRHFDLDTIPGVAVHVDDGRAFVAGTRAPRWDIAVVDAYDATRLAEGFATSAFFGALRAAIHPGGTVAVNVIGALVGASPVRDVVRATRRAFDEIRILPVIEEHEPCFPHAIRNVVVVARRAR